MTDFRTDAQRLLDMMKAAGAMPNPLLARQTALGIFRNNLADAAHGEPDLIAAFDGGATGRYVTAWLQEPLPIPQLADLLSVHLTQARKPEDMLQPEAMPEPPTDDPLALRLVPADHARRLKPEIIEALQDAVRQNPEMGRPDGEIEPRAALAWLAQFRPHLVPTVFSILPKRVPEHEPSTAPGKPVPPAKPAKPAKRQRTKRDKTIDPSRIDRWYHENADRCGTMTLAAAAIQQDLKCDLIAARAGYRRFRERVR